MSNRSADSAAYGSKTAEDPTPAATGADLAQPAPPSVALRHALAYEWHHLRGLRSTWILLGVAAAVAVGNGVSLLLVADARTAPTPAAVADALQWSPAATQLPLLALMLIGIGTSSVSTDLARGVAPTTWLTAASRATAFVAKVCVAALCVTVTAVATVLIAAASGAVALSLGGMPQPAWGQALPALFRFLLVMACWPLVAASAAALLRHRTATVMVLVLWPLIGERMAGLVLSRLLGADALPELLPFAAARAAMSGAPDGGNGTDALETALLGTGLPPWTGLLIYALFTFTVGAAGAWSYCRRNAP